ncbi:peptidoglycan-binding domain-containing protein [Yinghuangia sp. YIM S09857]|uniref:peptidoglycan-binding domain-containing protein n=1 Tax=Yinghuangia sp. YIM S09857 TaxID=3436929 RepID=UPI003F530DF6
MRPISRTARRSRTRAAVIMLSGVVAAGAGIVAPSAGASAHAAATPSAAAPRCNFVPQDFRPELGESSEGEAVAQVQCLITTRSAYSKKFDVSGIYGPETTRAVLWVQKCNKVAETGYTDPATWKVLYRAKKGCGKSAAKPAKPTKPATKPPTKPTTPTNTVKPTKPVKPAATTKPTKPAKPAAAIKPAEPGKPANPGKSTNPGKPKPFKPAVPAAPPEIGGGELPWDQRPV